MKVGDQHYFYQNDHLGTPQKMTAVNGAVVWSAKYSSFGEATVEVNTVENNLRFPGQYFDEETELYFNYHRYYDYKTGRYLREDPIGISAGANQYIYALNNPTNLIDPRGLESCKGRWKVQGTDGPINMWCICYWLCIPCDGPVIWSGNYKKLPSTFGKWINSGFGGAQGGDSCFCNKKPGSELDCTENECIDQAEPPPTQPPIDIPPWIHQEDPLRNYA